MRNYNTEQIDLPNEIWKDLYRFPQTKGIYFISNFGRYKRIIGNKFYYSIGSRSEKGHLYVALSLNGNVIAEPFMHDLVAEAFIRPLKENEVTHHLNKIKTQNNVENLIILSRDEHTSQHQKGKKHSQQHIQKICNTMKGKRKKFSQQFRMKQSQRMKGNTLRVGIKHSEETKRKMSLAHIKKVGA